MEILIGKGVLEKIPELCEKLGAEKKPVILVDPITKDIAGDKVKGLLENSELQIINDSTYSEVERVKKSLENPSCVIAVGGGKVIDPGKLLSFELGIPFISVPTAPSHDGIASDTAIITTEGKYKSYKVKAPDAFVADLDIIKNAPYRLIAAGAADIISNYTSVFDWKLAKEKGEDFNDEAAELGLKAADLVSKSVELIKNKDDKGLENLMKALADSSRAMVLAGSSRPASGAEHMFSHALDSLGRFALHGEQCGVGSIIMAYLQGQDWQKIKNLLKKLGAPTTAEELKVPEEKIIEALLKAKDIRKRYTILDEKILTKEKALEVCKKVGVV